MPLHTASQFPMCYKGVDSWAGNMQLYVHVPLGYLYLGFGLMCEEPQSCT